MTDTRLPIETMAEIKAAIGMPIHLAPFERVTHVQIKPTIVIVAIETFKTRGGAKSITFTHRGEKVLFFTPTPNGRWIQSRRMDVWDDNFTPIVEATGGRVMTNAEREAQREYEADCYRPGSSRNPMDNASRVTEGYTTKRMAAHWR